MFKKCCIFAAGYCLSVTISLLIQDPSDPIWILGLVLLATNLRCGLRKD